MISSEYHYSKHTDAYHDFVLEGMEKAEAKAMKKVGFDKQQAEFLKYFDKYVKQPMLNDQNMLNNGSRR